LKSKAKVVKPDKKKQPAKKTKAKGLTVLSVVALTKAEQLKLATKRSKTQFHSSHASGSGDEDDTQSKGNSEDEDNENDSDDVSDEGDDDNDGNDDDDDANDDDKQEGDDTNDDDEETDKEEENVDDEEKMDEEEDDKVTKELYKDVNINLGNKDVDMTDADQSGADQQNASQQSGFEQKEEDAHVTLTLVLDTRKIRDPTQSSSVSFDFTKTTPTPTPTTSEATTSFTYLRDFASVFKFNERVTNLEKDLSEIKQVGQHAQALSSILAIVDRYMDNKLGEAINKAIQAHNFDCREEAQAEKREYIDLVDSMSSYEAAATLSEFELIKILIDKMEKNKSFDVADYKRELYDALVKSYNTDKDIFESYGKVFLLKRSRDERDKDRDPFAGSDRGTKRRKLSKDVESSRDSKSKEKKSSSTSKDASQSQHNSFVKSAHAEEPCHTVEDSGM
ncbi:hypothetical protein Tco_1460606, partial [Tanacetum coccineum]